MKANELMIGDYVRYTDTESFVDMRQGDIVKVDALQGKYICVGNGWADEDMFEPIPLTAEILAKFGFNHLEGNQYRMTIASSQVDIHELGISVWFVDVEELKWDMPKQSAIVCSVHQLQHALRLFGVNKEGVEIG